MKIKVALLDHDKIYLDRIVKTFNTRFASEIQAYSFTDLDTAMKEIKKSRIQVFLAADQFEIDVELLPEECGFAYFIETPDINVYKGKAAICKYQKIDLIYKQILNLYSEVAENILGRKNAEGSCRTVVFSSPCGGTGTSTFAAAYALRKVRQGARVMYLNLETFGSSDTFFSGEGQYDLSDVIYALKTKKTNISIKIESCLKQDKSGVFFFSQSKTVLDFMEMGLSERETLLLELQSLGSFDFIIMDMDFSLADSHVHIYEKADVLVMVGDGGILSNMKLFRAYGAFQTLEETRDIFITDKLALMYNKFGSKTGRMLEALDIRTVGGVPRFENASKEQIVEELSQKTMFDRLI